MPRAIITKELSETIRSIRLQKRISLSEVAKEINKSPAFVSRVENCSLQSIDTRDLYMLLEFITMEHEANSIADEIYHSLTIKYSASEIRDQLWFKNFETVRCKIPIPEALVDEIKRMMNESEITRNYLIQRINANESLSDDDIENSNIPYNQWYSSDPQGKYKSIKIYISLETLDSILDRIVISTSYIYMLSIVYYLLKIQQYGERLTIDENENNNLMDEAVMLLNSYKFYSASEKNKIFAENKSQNRYMELLNSFDVENLEIINDIMAGLQYATTRNIADTNEKLLRLSKNMHWDLGFMLKLNSLGFLSLETISVTDKKSLLKDIEILIEKYSKLNDCEKPLEIY